MKKIIVLLVLLAVSMWCSAVHYRIDTTDLPYGVDSLDIFENETVPLYKNTTRYGDVKTYRFIVTVGQYADCYIPDKEIKMSLDICEELLEQTAYKRVNYELNKSKDWYGVPNCPYVKKIEVIIVEKKTKTLYPK